MVRFPVPVPFPVLVLSRSLSLSCPCPCPCPCPIPFPFSFPFRFLAIAPLSLSPCPLVPTPPLTLSLSLFPCAPPLAAVKLTRDTTAAEALKMAMDRFNPNDDGSTPYALYLSTDSFGTSCRAGGLSP